MKEAQPLDIPEYDTIDLDFMFTAVLRHKIAFLLTSATISIVVLIFAIYLPNVYRATATLKPSDHISGAGLAGLVGKFGGLASLAGLKLPQGAGDRVDEMMQTLKSRHFLIGFVKQHHLKVPLMAVKRWVMETNTLVYDSDVYDIKTKKWVRDVQAPLTPEPNDLETYEQTRENLILNKDKKTGIITLSFDYYSPTMAANIVNWLVADLNQYMRIRDMRKTTKNIEYLRQKVGKVGLADIRETLFNLIQEQEKTLMLSSVQNEYALAVIDPGYPPFEKNSPHRMVIVLLGAGVGGTFGIFLAVYLERRKKHTGEQLDD